MAQKRFGPTRGAGVAIIERDGEKSISPGALGMAGYAGMLEKGAPNKLLLLFTKTDFLKQCGSYLPESLMPAACIDYFSTAAGAGGLALIRVTDGNEVAAQMTLYARNASLLTPMGTIKAKNGGRWGGKEKKLTGVMASLGDATAITLTTGVTMKVDEYKGGYVAFSAVSNKLYPITGNNAAGLITVAADQNMLLDLGAATDLRYYVTLENAAKAVSIKIGDGEELPTSQFSLEVYVDGVFDKKYPDLSTDPTNARYWVSIINEDGANHQIEAVDLWSGAHVASVRPANHYGKIASVTATELTAVIHDFTINAPVSGGNPTMTLGTTTDDDQPQKITITMTAATTGTVVSDKFGALGTLTLGTLFNPHAAAGGALMQKWAPPITVTAGATPLVATDTLVINYKPFKPSALINGQVYPDKVNARRTFFRITANTHKVITVADGSDLTTDGAANDEFHVLAAIELAGGRDGHSSVVDATYLQKAWDTTLSPFLQLVGKNLGMLKFATPGVTSTAVQKGGIAYAAAHNHQYRVEVPSNVVTEAGVDAYCNDTIGRNDYAVVSFPSYGYVADPLGGGQGKLMLTTLTGMIHGREATVARDNDGYHKAAAGVEVMLPAILKLPTGDAVLNEEFLNPLGINIIKKKTGNFILWGDRTLWVDPAWRFKHHREMFSYYEHVLQENFDWIVFAINDPVTDKLALSALRTFFEKEWRKRALRGDTFEQAASIKVDSENNTTATRADGDLFADIGLRPADTVERFIIRIGKLGIFDSAA